MYDIDHKATRHLNHIVGGSMDAGHARCSIMTHYADEICKHVEELEHIADLYYNPPVPVAPDAHEIRAGNMTAEIVRLSEENDLLRREIEAIHVIYERVIKGMQS